MTTGRIVTWCIRATDFGTRCPSHSRCFTAVGGAVCEWHPRARGQERLTETEKPGTPSMPLGSHSCTPQTSSVGTRAIYHVLPTSERGHEGFRVTRQREGAKCCHCQKPRDAPARHWRQDTLRGEELTSQRRGPQTAALCDGRLLVCASGPRGESSGMRWVQCEPRCGSRWPHTRTSSEHDCDTDPRQHPPRAELDSPGTQRPCWAYSSKAVIIRRNLWSTITLSCSFDSSLWLSASVKVPPIRR